MVLVPAQRLSLLQERRRHVLRARGREPVPRDLRRWTELHRASLGHSAGAGRPRCPLPIWSARGRAHRCRPPSSSCCRLRIRSRENVLREDEILAEVVLPRRLTPTAAARTRRCSTANPGPMRSRAWRVVLDWMARERVPARACRARRRGADPVGPSRGGARCSRGGGSRASSRRAPRTAAVAGGAAARKEWLQGYADPRLWCGGRCSSWPGAAEERRCAPASRIDRRDFLLASSQAPCARAVMRTPLYAIHGCRGRRATARSSCGADASRCCEQPGERESWLDRASGVEPT